MLPMGENREVDFAFLVSNDSTKVRWEFMTNFSQVRFDKNQVLANVSVALIDFSNMKIRKEITWGRNSECLKLSAY